MNGNNGMASIQQKEARRAASQGSIRVTKKRLAQLNVAQQASLHLWSNCDEQ